MLSAVNDLIMTTQAACTKPFPLFKRVCEAEACDEECKSKSGVDAHGFCFTVTYPNDTCQYRYPC